MVAGPEEGHALKLVLGLAGVALLLLAIFVPIETAYDIRRAGGVRAWLRSDGEKDDPKAD